VKDLAQDVAEDVLGAAKDGSIKLFIVKGVYLAHRHLPNRGGVYIIYLAHRHVNDTELIQRGGLFTEGRWRKQPIAEVLTLNTHIKRHSSVESYGEASPRSTGFCATWDCISSSSSSRGSEVCRARGFTLRRTRLSG